MSSDKEEVAPGNGHFDVPTAQKERGEFCTIADRILRQISESPSRTEAAADGISHVAARLPDVLDTMRNFQVHVTNCTLDPELQTVMKRVINDSLRHITAIEKLIERVLPTASRVGRAKRAVVGTRKQERAIVAGMEALEKCQNTMLEHFGTQLSQSTKQHLDIQDEVGENLSAVTREKLQVIKRWLKPSTSTYLTHLPGTCEWIWTEPALIEWSKPSADDGRILCVSGAPGCGKSVLASSVAKGLTSGGYTTLFWSFSGLDSERQILDSLARSLMWQLLEDASDQAFAIADGLLRGGTSATTSELLDAVAKVGKTTAGPIFCVIDGVDECREGQDTDTPHEWLRMALDLAHTGKFHVALFGRPSAFPNMTDVTPLTIEITPNSIRTDIETFVYAGIVNSKILNTEEFRNTALLHLLEKAEGIFVWAKLALDDLSRSSTATKVAEKLHRTPRGLDQIYRFILVRLLETLSTADLNLSRKIFTFMTVSCGSLSLDELRCLCESDDGLGFDQRVLSLCGDLITTTDGRVQLIHNSVREFLTRPEKEWSHRGDERIQDFRVDVNDAHRSLARRCVEYLDMADYDIGPDDADAVEKLVYGHPFLEYASRRAISHFLQSGPPCADTLEKVYFFLESPKFVAWVEYLTLLLLHDSSDIMVLYEFDAFEGWMGVDQVDLTKRLRSLLEQEMAIRATKFGDEDIRTQRLHGLLHLLPDTESTEDDSWSDFSEPDPHTEALQGPTRTREPIHTVSHMVNIIRDHSVILIPKQLDLVLKLQTHLRRGKILTEPLKVLLQMILGHANRLPAVVLVMIGNYLYNLDRYDDAENAYRAALSRTSGAGQLRYEIMGDIGSVLLAQKKTAEAEEIAREGLEGITPILGMEHENTLDVASTLAASLSRLERCDEAVDLYRQVLSGREKLFGKEDRRTLKTVKGLGTALSHKGDHAESEVNYRRALRGLKKRLGDDHKDVLNMKLNIGRTLSWQDKRAEAEEVFRDVLQQREKVLGVDQRDTLVVLTDLGHELYHQEKHEEAEAVYRRVITGLEKIAVGEREYIIGAFRSLGAIFLDLRRYADAGIEYRRALRVYEEEFGLEHKETVQIRGSFCVALVEEKKYDEAEPLLQRVIEWRTDNLGKDDPNTLSAVDSLAVCYHYQRREAEAEKLHRENWERRKRVLGETNRATLRSLNNLGSTIESLRRDAKVDSVYRESLEGLLKVAGCQAHDTLQVYKNLCLLLEKENKHSELRDLHQQMWKARKKALGSTHVQTIRSLNDIAVVRFKQGKYMEAMRFRQRAFWGFRRTLGNDDQETQKCRIVIWQRFREQGRTQKAMRFWQWAERLGRSQDTEGQ